MSKSAHAQGAIKLRQLPKCSRCKQQFMLVTARYEDKNGRGQTVEEWECTKCNKVVLKEHLKEVLSSEDEEFFHKKAKELQHARREDEKRDREKALRRDLANKNSK